MTPSTVRTVKFSATQEAIVEVSPPICRPPPPPRAAVDVVVDLTLGDVGLELLEGRRRVASVEATDRHDRTPGGQLVARSALRTRGRRDPGVEVRVLEKLLDHRVADRGGAPAGRGGRATGALVAGAWPSVAVAPVPAPAWPVVGPPVPPGRPPGPPSAPGPDALLPTTAGPVVTAPPVCGVRTVWIVHAVGPTSAATSARATAARVAVVPRRRPRSTPAAASRPTTRTTQRSHGFQSGDRERTTKAQPVVTSEVPASTGRAHRSVRRVQTSHPPIPTSAPIDGARATV